MAPWVHDNPPSYNDPDEDESLPPISNFHIDDVIHHLSSTDTDSEEEWTADGYELLPQDVENESNRWTEQVDAERDSEAVAATASVINPEQLGEQLTTTTVEGQHLQAAMDEASPDGAAASSRDEAGATSTETQSPMDQDHIDKIKAAMCGFTLPSTSIPSWANVIPEEKWKAQLLVLMKSFKEQKND